MSLLEFSTFKIYDKEKENISYLQAEKIIEKAKETTNINSEDKKKYLTVFLIL